MGCYTSKFEKVKLTEPYPACLSYLSDDSSLCSYTKPTAGKTFVHRLGAYLLYYLWITYKILYQWTTASFLSLAGIYQPYLQLLATIFWLHR